jgi:hypothetical protein
MGLCLNNQTCACFNLEKAKQLVILDLKCWGCKQENIILVEELELEKGVIEQTKIILKESKQDVLEVQQSIDLKNKWLLVFKIVIVVVAIIAISEAIAITIIEVKE